MTGLQWFQRHRSPFHRRESPWGTLGYWHATRASRPLSITLFLLHGFQDSNLALWLRYWTPAWSPAWHIKPLEFLSTVTRCRPPSTSTHLLLRVADRSLLCHWIIWCDIFHVPRNHIPLKYIWLMFRCCYWSSIFHPRRCYATTIQKR